jgi:hypothetical protein
MSSNIQNFLLSLNLEMGMENFYNATKKNFTREKDIEKKKSKDHFNQNSQFLNQWITFKSGP